LLPPPSRENRLGSRSDREFSFFFEFKYALALPPPPCFLVVPFGSKLVFFLSVFHLSVPVTVCLPLLILFSFFLPCLGLVVFLGPSPCHFLSLNNGKKTCPTSRHFSFPIFHPAANWKPSGPLPSSALKNRPYSDDRPFSPLFSRLICYAQKIQRSLKFASHHVTPPILSLLEELFHLFPPCFPRHLPFTADPRSSAYVFFIPHPQYCPQDEKGVVLSPLLGPPLLFFPF